MRGTAKSFDELRAYCETLPIVDCHDHSGECGPEYKDAIQVIIAGYFHSDIHSALNDREMAVLEDTSRSMESRWPILEKAWKRTRHTGYAMVTRKVLEEFYGEHTLTLDVLMRIQDNLLDFRDLDKFESVWIKQIS
jgi:hypothetical protein